mmetsp:Transcript_22562/g.36276  ORF Transcript_22562/g.36276 Transcript_22562/m.36276 type:complete len:140 (+) Transcript_22562:210-629(+)
MADAEGSGGGGLTKGSGIYLKVAYTTSLLTNNARNTQVSSFTSGGLRVLSTDLNTPDVAKSSVETNLLHTLEVFTHFLYEFIGNALHHLVGLAITLPVEEPVWNVELVGVLKNSHNLIDLITGEFSRPFVDIDIGTLAD